MLKQGEVIRYPYLWRWQEQRGETEGRKHRPACVALVLPKAGLTHLFLLALTGTPPRAGQLFLKVPETEIHRLGLRDEKPVYVIIDECNYDIVERSFHLDPTLPPLGRFSESFVNQIKEAFRRAIETNRMNRIDRK